MASDSHPKLLRAIADQNNGEVITLLKEMSIEQVNDFTGDVSKGWYFYKESKTIGQVDSYYLSPLHMACLVDNRTAVAVLLGLDGINVNQQVQKMTRQLKLYLNSLALKESDCIGWKFEVGSRNSFPFEGYTPIMIAAVQKRREIFTLLTKDDRVNLKSTVQHIFPYLKPKERVAEQPETVETKSLHMFLELVDAIGKRESIEKTVKPTKTPQEVALQDLSSSFGDLLKSGEMSDFRIVCGGEEIPCHKNILIARSNVLRNMMANDMKESQENCMQITDLKPHIVQIFVQFIYTGEVASENLKKYAEDLFEVGHRYELNGLIKLCQNEMITHINNTNVLAIVTKAHMYHADKLREACMKWIVNHRKNIVKPEGWRENLKRFPDLLMDIMEAFTS